MANKQIACDAVRLTQTSYKPSELLHVKQYTHTQGKFPAGAGDKYDDQPAAGRHRLEVSGSRVPTRVHASQGASRLVNVAEDAAGETANCRWNLLSKFRGASKAQSSPGIVRA